MTAFDQFWASYWRREAKKDAERAWRQIAGDQHADAILEALVWQTPMMRQRERQYQPLAATWLRGERWNDERPETDAERSARRRAEMVEATRLREAAETRNR